MEFVCAVVYAGLGFYNGIYICSQLHCKCGSGTWLRRCYGLLIGSAMWPIE